LLEPQRTNLIEYSEEFDNAYWSKGSGSSVVADQDIAPDGTLTADRVDSPVASGIRLDRILTCTPDTVYTFSFYCKNIDKTSINYRIDTTAGATIIPTTNYISEINTSTYTRIIVTFTTPPINTDLRVFIDSASSAGSFFVWGAQVEAGSYATSYIPTLGTSVTRVQDTASKTGIGSLINSEEGVLYVELSAFNDQTLNNWISVSEDANINNNQFNLRFVANSNLIQVVSRAAGLGQDVVLNYTLTDKTALNKIAIKYKINDWALWVNGVEVDTEKSSTAFTANSLDVLDFNRGNDSNFFYGKVQNLMVFPSALSDTQLAELTA
jgi:hypothetical protein